MERIEEAIRKAKTSPNREKNGANRHRPERTPAYSSTYIPMSDGATDWNVPRARLDSEHLERNKVVTHAMTDPGHVAFKILRTKLYQILSENHWTSIAVTSPTSGCGKTMIAANLAFSLARQSDCRTVLIDLDLKKTSVGNTMGLRAQKSISQYFSGEARLEDCFVQADDNLFVGLNHSVVKNFSEMAADRRVKELLPNVMDALRPKVVIFDLPPMLSGDEVMAFMPQVDSGFLVGAAGKTTTREIEECENQFSAATNFLGVVLNKCEDQAYEDYQYQEY